MHAPTTNDGTDTQEPTDPENADAHRLGNRGPRSEQKPTRSWAEIWALSGADPDGVLSTTQADLAADAYHAEKTPAQAVRDHDLTEVHRDGVDGGFLVGYRLIGEPEEVSR